METMKCYDCALKHLAAAVSYAKEIMSGHGQGAELDHRPDLLGELVNAEHHLKLLDNNLCQAVGNLRRGIQDRRTMPVFADIEYLRRIWQLTEQKTTNESSMAPGCRGCGNSSAKTSSSVDIVIPLNSKGSGHNNLELRYALRSIEKYLKNYRDIIVVSSKAPEWLRNVKVIDSVPDASRKNINLFRKRLKAAEVSDADFNLYWCDDYVLLKNSGALAIPVLNADKNLPDYSGKSVWHQVLRATGEALQKHGKTAVHCEAHTPSLTDRKKFLELGEIFKVERETEPGLAVCSLYHNYYSSRMLGMDQMKLTAEGDCGGALKVAKQCAGRLFLGYNDKGFDSGVKEFLEKKFPNQSKYEAT